MSRNSKCKAKQEVAKAYTPTDAEEDVISSLRIKREARLRGAEIRLEEDDESGVVNLDFDHVDQATAQALAMHEIGTADIRFYFGILDQIASIGKPGQRVSQHAANFTLSAMAGIQPRDEVESMLALQMATVHQASMVMARRLTQSDTVTQQDSAERAFNKLARTYAAQVEALKRHRSNGKQVVRVERVTVNEGGRAIVGEVHHGCGGKQKNDDNPIHPESQAKDARLP